MYHNEYNGKDDYCYFNFKEDLQDFKVIKIAVFPDFSGQDTFKSPQSLKRL